MKPEVSLYDHSKTTAALAAALWRWHEAEGKTDVDARFRTQKPQRLGRTKNPVDTGDFFGIQNFTFRLRQPNQ